MNNTKRTTNKLPEKYKTCDWLWNYGSIGLTKENIKRLNNAINILESLNEHTLICQITIENYTRQSARITAWKAPATPAQGGPGTAISMPGATATAEE